MIPMFPEFKKLELSDKNEIEVITSKYPPYSDFNFMSMWSWDIKDDMRISILNNNLIVRFTDYLTGEPFYSFLGNFEVNDTAEKIIEYSKLFGGGGKLKLVPEISIKELDKNKFSIIEDVDCSDYILDAKKICEYEGSEYRTKRTDIKKILRNYPNIKFIDVDISKKDIRENIIELNKNWIQHKSKINPTYVTEKEFIAINKYLASSDHENIFSSGVFINDEMVAYCISEILPHEGFAISHFAKTQNKYKGLQSFLNKEHFNVLLVKGVKLVNFEQDLGLPGLREYKKSLRPVIYLKKYTVSFLNVV